MKVTQVSICPTEASSDAKRPSLTPELLAATGARYSRNNEGLDAILEKIDPDNLDKSVDSIFRMVDYGHASIGDMAPVAMFMDGVSILLAYHLWALCPLAGGQESSTRYIRMDASGLLEPWEIGIPDGEVCQEFLLQREEAFEAYEKALTFWESILSENPALARIPYDLLNDTSEKAQKQVARMKRNYAFDRARVFLPVSAKTNVMMVQSARQWVALCQNLLSMPLMEANNLGERIREELKLVAPRLIKHAVRSENRAAGMARELERNKRCAIDFPDVIAGYPGIFSCEAHIDVMDPLSWVIDRDEEIRDALHSHVNRYEYIGPDLSIIAVHFGWRGVGFAEIRDLNRHRTGTKHCPLMPCGFHYAADQVPKDNLDAEWELRKLSSIGAVATNTTLARLRVGDPSYAYHCLLGTQFPFSHTTTADKFIYEAELRTGAGAHYRYAKHLHDVLELWCEKFPSTRGLILEGSAEPE